MVGTSNKSVPKMATDSTIPARCIEAHSSFSTIDHHLSSFIGLTSSLHYAHSHARTRTQIHTWIYIYIHIYIHTYTLDIWYIHHTSSYYTWNMRAMYACICAHTTSIRWVKHCRERLQFGKPQAVESTLVTEMFNCSAKFSCNLALFGIQNGHVAGEMCLTWVVDMTNVRF